jgi:hypothetical protein
MLEFVERWSKLAIELSRVPGSTIPHDRLADIHALIDGNGRNALI